MASPPHRDGPELEAGHLRPLSEKELILAAGSPPVTSRLYQAPKENMPSARRLLLVLMVSLMAALGVASAMSTVERPRRSEDMAGRDAESAVDSVAHAVEDAAPDSLHALLHKYFPDRFKHGVWASDEEAAEAVPELAKRANSTTAPPSSTGDPSSDPTSGPSSTPGDDTTSDNPPSTTTGGSESQSPTPTETVPSTTEEAPSTSNPPSSSPEPTKTSSSTSKKPTSHLTTTTYTSTNSDGGVVIVTATTYVPGAGDSGSATTSGPPGSLQTNAANLRYGRENILEAVAAGIVAGGALLI